MPDIPSPAWIHFGAELRRIRKQAGLSVTEVGKAVSLSAAMVSAIERGTRKPKRDRAEAFDQLFATEGAVVRRWADATNLDADPYWHQQVVRSEEKAAEIRMWHPTIVPGILQIPDYARAVFNAGRPLDTPAEIDQLVKARKRRVEALVRAGGPVLWAIVDEAVIRRVVGDLHVMGRQLAHLAELADSAAVRLSVVPSDTPNHPGLSGPFRLLSFDSRAAVVYGEHSGGGQLIESAPDVRRHIAIFEELRGWALTPIQSLELIKKVGEL